MGNGDVDADAAAVPLLGPDVSESSSSSDQDSRNQRIVSIRVNSFCLPEQPVVARTHRLQSFQRTVKVLQLDHSHYKTSLLSWVIGVILVVGVPILRLCFVKEASNDSKYELVFQPFTVVVGSALSTISFVFLTQAIRKYGIRGVLFLDAAEEEVMEIQEEYDTIIEQCRMLLAKLFIPAFVLYVFYKAWFYAKVELQPLPFEKKLTSLSLSIIITFSTLSWVFQTAVFLYSCVLFSTVCSLQELKMLKFKGLLEDGFDPEFYFSKYTRVIKGLRATSHRFRAFLALIFALTIVGFLASMYKVVEAERSGISTFMAGEIVILNWVGLFGVGLCLKSSSKLSHLHRRIVKAAASMHARLTFETGKLADSSMEDAKKDLNTDSLLQKFSSYFQYQDACSRRAALVNYLSSMSVGISVYGFVLDRFFIHASIGALLTTLWFILGRSLTN
ncbi:hypothetical protein L7F22_061834 [Adiantum nelumboides]|nr:hypothetical protein [Adiantum nelumboides]